MDAMIFAAGLGTRLGAIGTSTPKALLDVGGMTMLERAARALIVAGADRLIVNVHHHADAIERFIDGWPLDVETLISHEVERPLETGGGLLAARGLFRGDGPFLLHNVDVTGDFDLHAVLDTHRTTGALATLAVNDRPSSRGLLFDGEGLYGRIDRRHGLEQRVREPRGETVARAFAGVHAGSPELLELLAGEGAFSIIDAYMRLAEAGHRIAPCDVTGSLWLEIGNPERLEAARAALGSTRDSTAGEAPA
jgi:NDP-sugar pyrophosphorylase family protein